MRSVPVVSGCGGGRGGRIKKGTHTQCHTRISAHPHSRQRVVSRHADSRQARDGPSERHHDAARRTRPAGRVLRGRLLASCGKRPQQGAGMSLRARVCSVRGSFATWAIKVQTPGSRPRALLLGNAYYDDTRSAAAIWWTTIHGLRLS